MSDSGEIFIKSARTLGPGEEPLEGEMVINRIPLLDIEDADGNPVTPASTDMAALTVEVCDTTTSQARDAVARAYEGLRGPGPFGDQSL